MECCAFSGESLDSDLTVVSLLPTAEPERSRLRTGTSRLARLVVGKRRRVRTDNRVRIFSIKGERSAVFATLFSFSEGATPDLNYQEVDASGRNGKFRWSATGQQHTLSFKMPVEGDLSVGYSVEPSPSP